MGVDHFYFKFKVNMSISLIRFTNIPSGLYSSMKNSKDLDPSPGTILGLMLSDYLLSGKSPPGGKVAMDMNGA